MFPKKKNTYIFLILMIVMYIFVALLTLQTGTHMSTDNSIIDAVNIAFNQILIGNVNIFPITNSATQLLLFVTLIYVAITLLFIYDAQKNRRDAIGIENGSAKWNTNYAEYNKKYSDPENSPKNNGDYNTIYTQDISLNMNTRITMRNNNSVVIGGSGAGKTRFFAKPNILQANSSLVITDPAGELLETTAAFLKSQGYKIKIFNLVDMKHSNCYNPFNYIRDDLGVLMLINCLIKNTTPPTSKASDPFWEKSETALLQALIFYLISYRPKHEQNFSSVMKLLRAAKVDESNPSGESTLDRIFKEVAKKDPNSIALKQYLVYRQAPDRTLMSILVSAAVRLTAFNIPEIENLTGTDNIDLGTLGDEKQALYVVIPAADDTYNFIVSMMYTQLFETLYYHAENECEGKRLKHHVRFLLDEFANIGQIPDFTKKLSTMRKYEISCSIILQNLSQLKTLYKDEWEGILGNCDSFLFLGGQEFSTLEHISKELGDATIVVRDTGRSRGKSGSSSHNFKRQARKLMTPDELLVMDNADCILIIRGLRPFYGKKFDYVKHKNYKYTGDANAEYMFPFRDLYNNGKKEAPHELSSQIKEERAIAIRSAIEIDEIEDTLNVTAGEVDQAFMRVIKAKKPEDIKDKLLKKRPESGMEIKDAENMDEIMYSTKN